MGVKRPGDLRGTEAIVRDRRRVATDDWRHSAACLDEDPELFFPASTGDAIAEAKAVCHRCDVKKDCLLWALQTGERFGVWGGLSEDERRALKRHISRARRASVTTDRTEKENTRP